MLKINKIAVAAIAMIGAINIANANEIRIETNKPIMITYKIIHQNRNSQPIFGPAISAPIRSSLVIPVKQSNYDLVGIIPISVDGHTLPDSANQFNNSKQCSVTTDKIKTNGSLVFTKETHKISCQTKGGIFR
jgi:hypothetical protein